MNRLWNAALTLILLSLLTLAGAACSGGQGPEGPLGSPAGPDSQTAPDLNNPDADGAAEAPEAAEGLPRPSEVRAASGSFSKTVEASNYAMRSLGAEPLPDETDMRLDCGNASKREWAIYYSQIGNAQIGPLQLKLKSGTLHKGSYWVGYGDYAYDCWRWKGPFSSSASLPAPLVSDDQNVVVAIVTPTGSTFTFDKLELELSGLGVEAILSADPPQGDAPLGVGFSAVDSQSFDFPVAKYEWDFDGDGSYDIDSGTDPTVDHGYSEPGWFYARLRVTDSSGDSDIAEQLVKVTLGGTVPPVAALEVQPADIEAGEQVLLDGSNSSDIDGSIVLCSWDFDGDGVFDQDTGPQKFTNHVYDQAGSFNVTLLVVDDGGMSDEISVPITVHGWSKVVVDAGPGAGLGLSLADVNGGPAIAYYVSQGTALKYAVSSSAEGLSAADWTVGTIDGAGSADVGKQPDLAVIDGRPAISYFDATAGALRYSRSSTPLGANPASWTSIELDNSDFCGQGSSLAVISGNPAISYYGGNLGLRYARCKNASGSGDSQQWDFVSVSGGSLDGLYTSLAEIGGKPAIAFMDKPFDDLVYAHASDAAGLSADKWSLEVVDEDSENGKNPTLMNVGGTPGIIYYNSGAQQLRYARSGSVAGSSWPTKLLLDDAGGMGSGFGASGALIGGKPSGVCLQGGSLSLKYFHSTTSTGENLGFWQSEDVDTTGEASNSISLCQINGKPAVAFHNNADNSLIYAIQN